VVRVPASHSIVLTTSPLTGTQGPTIQSDHERPRSHCVRHIRREYDVKGLCISFRERLQEVVDAKGDRLSHRAPHTHNTFLHWGCQPYILGTVWLAVQSLRGVGSRRKKLLFKQESCTVRME
jgi:hypothetical protein